MNKKFLAILICLGMSVFVCSCSNAGKEALTKRNTDSPASQNSDLDGFGQEDESSVQAEETTITDQAGRTVVISGGVERIAVCWYMANDFVLAMDAGDKLIAVGPYDDFQTLVLPSLSEMETVGRGRPDMEKMAALKPDLFVHTVGDKDNIEAVEALGIPMIQIDPETIADTLEAYHLVGRAAGNQERAIMLEEYYWNLIRKADEITGEVREEDRLSFVILGKEQGKVAHGRMIQSEMIVNGGGVNLAADVQGGGFWPEVGMERIFTWDPDVIFISQTAEYDVEDLIDDPSWSGLNAVKNGTVYKIPGSLHNWENPGMGTGLATLWAADKMYPGKLGAAEFDQIVADFYQDIYGLTIDKSDLGY